MPWTLQYPHDLDGRITRNGHRAVFAAHGDVANVSIDGTTLRVVFVGDPDRQTLALELLEIYRQYRQPDPLADILAYIEELHLDDLGNWPRREDVIRTAWEKLHLEDDVL